MRYLLLLAFAVYVLSQCKNFTKKNTYANLPADSAQYMIWCDELKDDSNRADLLYKRATYLFGKQLFLRALADANRASSLDTTKSEYFALLGNICFAVNKTKISALAFERSISLDKENYSSYLKLGELYYIVKEHLKSLQNFDEALRIQPGCEQCYFYKGLNYRELVQLPKHNEMAEVMFQKAIAINPNYFDAYIQLGELNDTLKPAIALAYFNAAVKLHPASVEALYHRAYHYQGQHNYDSAGADYKRIVEINPNFINAYFNVAYMNMEQHNWKQAIEGFKLVTKLDNNNAGAWYNLGLCYEKTNEHEKAKKAYNECLYIDREFANAAERLRSLK